MTFTMIEYANLFLGMFSTETWTQKARELIMKINVERLH
jgi:hypothetical protein